ncbi:uncharacterized protein LOC134282440 [Saccostrea cucullata]|uniref:uncharacterized protein LOC134282440 n=1 Tax=Saccostrea cuccullata TaxID=36930 RepID=UPI002ED002D4
MEFHGICLGIPWKLRKIYIRVWRLILKLILTDDCIITILKVQYTVSLSSEKIQRSKACFKVKRPFCATKKLFRKGRTGGFAFLVQFKEIFKMVRSEGGQLKIMEIQKEKEQGNI